MSARERCQALRLPNGAAHDGQEALSGDVKDAGLSFREEVLVDGSHEVVETIGHARSAFQRVTKDEVDHQAHGLAGLAGRCPGLDLAPLCIGTGR
jgi:hypothetical protein